jgi:hypothetical protein
VEKGKGEGEQGIFYPPTSLLPISYSLLPNFYFLSPKLISKILGDVRVAWSNEND